MEEHTKKTPIIKPKSMKVFAFSFLAFSLSEVFLHVVDKIQTFVLPIDEFLGLVVALLIADWITGIRAAKTRGERIVAAKMQKTIEKMVLYFIAMLLSEGMRITFFPSFPITYITALSISATEFKSNIENIELVTGVRIWDSIKERFSFFLRKK